MNPPETIEIRRVCGRDVIPYLPAIAKLRIEVFREYPYLYAGSQESEQEYLEFYASSDRSVFVLAVKDGEIIGAATGLPLTEADDAFQRPFLETGIDPEQIFYFGESVLRKSERGQGIGHRFFDEREMHATAHGFSITAFCAVERPDHHPQKPEDYRPNDTFWQKRGYQKDTALWAKLSWPQVDAGTEEIRNRLTFWLKGAI